MAWNASAAATTVFTADNEHIFTVTLDLSVQACKNAILSLANVAWYMLHAVQSQSSAVSASCQNYYILQINFITFETIHLA